MYYENLATFYNRSVLPKLINFAMTRDDLTRLRAAYVPAASGVVLEIGIGSGLNLPFYTAAVSRVYGVDPSAELLARAREKAAAAPFPVEFFHQDADRIPLADASVDTVVVTWSLCSIGDPAAALSEMRRVLKADGTLIFVEHGLAPDAGVRKWQNRLTPFWRRFTGGCHLNRKMDDLVRDGGFTIADLRTEYVPGPRAFAFMYEGRARKIAKNEKRITKNEKRITNRDQRQHRMAQIRLATIDDASAIAAIYGPYCDATVISFEETAPSVEEMGRRIATIGAERPWIVLESASENGGAVIGYAYASAHHDRAAYRWSVSTAIYVNRNHHRRGAGRALYSTLFELLRALGYRQATAGITLPNPASVGLHAAFGFAPVGVYRRIGYKMGGWHDVGWYQVEIQPASEHPTDPRSIREIAGTPEWHAAVARGLEQYGRNEKRKTKNEKRITNNE